MGFLTSIRRTALVLSLLVLALAAGPRPRLASLGAMRPALKCGGAVPQAGSGGQVSYTPTQIRHAYGFDKISADGAGQIIGIIVAFGSPTLQTDFATFCGDFALPITTSTLTVIQSGPITSSDQGWALETSLDVEWAHAIAPAAKLLLVVAPTAQASDLFAAVEIAESYRDAVTGQRVNQISMSWGTTSAESAGELLSDYLFTTPGVSYFASAGDEGPGVLYPAISPNVVGVGGTTLLLTANGGVVGETPWSSGGGGTSTVEPEPAFQQSWQSSGFRQMPDVSYDADTNTGFQVYDSTPYNGLSGWLIAGGTSAGAPQWAALMALVNSQAEGSLGGTVGALYQLASQGQSGYFRTPTGGATGYNTRTGLGSPLAASLFPALLGLVSKPPTITDPSSPLENGAVGTRFAATFAATGAASTWAVTGGALPSGMSLSADGVYTGTPTAAGTSTFTVTATNAAGKASGVFVQTILGPPPPPPAPPAPPPAATVAPPAPPPLSVPVAGPVGGGGGGGGGCSLEERRGSPVALLPLLGIVGLVARRRLGETRMRVNSRRGNTFR